MSRPAGCVSAKKALAAAVMASLLGGLVLLSLVVDRSAKAPLPVSVVALGGRRMAIRANVGLADLSGASEGMRDGEDDPLSSSKRRVPNGPDPIHNRIQMPSVHDKNKIYLDGIIEKDDYTLSSFHQPVPYCHDDNREPESQEDRRAGHRWGCTWPDEWKFPKYLLWI